MYKRPKFSSTSIKRNESTAGLSIEKKLRLMKQNKEKAGEEKPLIYQERKEGIGRVFNIREDRFETAIDATEKIASSYLTSRENSLKEEEKTEETDTSEKTEN